MCALAGLLTGREVARAMVARGRAQHHDFRTGASASLRGSEHYEARPDNGILRPDDIAETYWAIHAHPRSAWSYEVDLRPYEEPW